MRVDLNKYVIKIENDIVIVNNDCPQFELEEIINTKYPNNLVFTENQYRVFLDLVEYFKDCKYCDNYYPHEE